MITRIKHWRERRRLLRKGYTRTFQGGTIRIVYTEDHDLYAVTPDGARWKCKPGVVFTATTSDPMDMNEDQAELIEEGPDNR